MNYPETEPYRYQIEKIPITLQPYDLLYKPSETLKWNKKYQDSLKNIENANYFAIIRSIVDTTLKNGNDVFQTFRLLAMNNFVAAE